MTATDSGSEANLGIVYEQLCLTYRALDDFRAKLLGFLPVVTGGGLLLLNGDGALPDSLFLPVGLFGLAVTLGLLCYEIYGIEKCHALLEAGEALEASMGVVAGQFRSRPRAVLGLINEPFAAAVIYPATMAVWSYLARLDVARTAGLAAAAVTFVAACSATLAYNDHLGRMARRARAEAAASA